MQLSFIAFPLLLTNAKCFSQGQIQSAFREVRFKALAQAARQPHRVSRLRGRAWTLKWYSWHFAEFQLGDDGGLQTQASNMALAFAGKRVAQTRGPALLRPFKAPTSLAGNQLNQGRLFTQNHPLLLLTRTSSPRPQLPYLSQPSRPATHPRGPAFQRQIARLLTTENRSYVKEQVWLATKWSAVGWTMVFMLAMAYYGWQQELIERDHPSPDEWSYFTRTAFRHAQARLNPDFDGTGVTDWAANGSEFRVCLARLENLNKDGARLVPVILSEEDILGVNPTTYDISAKSYAWKSGYFQVVMGCARAAEFLDDMVADKTRRVVFPKDVVIGPSNPDPRPTPPGAVTAPLEENCTRPYAPPETFYMKVLTGAGFTTTQRLEAALAYANWLEFKGLQSTAEETYRWAIDIAASAIPGSETLIDSTSAIINVNPTSTNSVIIPALPTPNLLRATTALATHHARTGNIQSALPIYLSVLRARRSAPQESSAITQSALTNKAAAFNSHAGTDYGAAWGLLRSIIRSSEYPIVPDFGDDAFLRSPETDKDCAEAELMVYIGEILFATQGKGGSEEGLGWTKQAVAIAEAGAADAALTQDGRQVCKSCLDTAVTNWGAMVRKLLREEKAREANSILPSPSKGWSSWFGGGDKDGEKEVAGSKWEEELVKIEVMRERLIREGVSERLAASKGAPSGVWMG